MPRLTPKRLAALQAAADNRLWRSGYMDSLYDSFIDGERGKVTDAAGWLAKAGLIRIGDHFASLKTPWHITDAGRTALREATGGGGQESR